MKLIRLIDKRLALSIVLLILCLLPACKQVSWKLVMNHGSPVAIAVNPTTGELVVGDPTTGSVNVPQSVENPFLRKDSFLERLDTEQQGRIYEICFPDDVWVRTWSGKMFSYAMDAGSWTPHPEFNDLGARWECSVSPENQFIVWNFKKIALHDDQWIWAFPPDNELITDVVQDERDVLWVATVGGRIYKVENNQWLLANVHKQTIDHIVVLSNGDLWLSDDDKVYAWNPDSGSGETDLVFDLSDKDCDPDCDVTHVFEDSLGRRWIITAGGLWVYQGSTLTRIGIPIPIRQRLHEIFFPGFNYLADAAFDYQKDRLYIASNHILVYIDTATVQLPQDE